MVEGLTSSATDQGSAAGSEGIHRVPGARRNELVEIEDFRPPNDIDQTHEILVTLAERPHPFPSRTRKLSSPAPKILRGQPFGNIGRRQDFCVSGVSGAGEPGSPIRPAARPPASAVGRRRRRTTPSGPEDDRIRPARPLRRLEGRSARPVQDWLPGPGRAARKHQPLMPNSADSRLMVARPRPLLLLRRARPTCVTIRPDPRDHPSKPRSTIGRPDGGRPRRAVFRRASPPDAQRAAADRYPYPMTEPNDELATPLPRTTASRPSSPRRSRPRPRRGSRPPDPPGLPTGAAATSPAAATARAADVTGAAASPAVAATILVGRRHFARTTPVVVDRGRASFGLPSLADRRQAGQIGLVVLMIAALGAILLARGGGTGSPGIAGGGSPSPQASLAASPQPTPRPSPSPSGSAGPGPSAAPASAKPSPTAKPRTYTVKSGDTLSGIASRFHTTPKAIERANGLKSPYVIHPGQVLKLP